jgi:two-component system invasion response regulator UvrY
MKKITIVIIDDHKLIREMWAKLLSGRTDIEVTGESGRLNDAVEMVKIKRPDIVFLDINLADASGLDAVPFIRKFAPGSRIIAVSMHTQPVYAKKMFRLGAKGYITKNSSHHEMLQAVDEVMKGGIYICSEIKDALAGQALQDDNNELSVNDLSLREIEIIKLIKEGLTSKEISACLNISVRTVEVHRHNILKKLKLKNAPALINFIKNTDLGFL